LDQKGKLLLDDFKPQLLYFRNRYVTNGLTNSKFMGLKFRRNDSEELVKNVLEGNDNELPNVVLALLVIVFRLRNNMFHGIKALPTIGGQVGNFKHANKLLMKLIEME
jgi:hypothetical protein